MIKAFKKEILVDGVLEKTSFVVREVTGEPEVVKWNLEMTKEEIEEMSSAVLHVLKNEDSTPE